MISHKHQCIFIHNTKTGGTSIEKALIGEDMEKVCPEQKHLTAKEARVAYSEHWDAYTKFTFVRNPWDKVLSHYFFRCADAGQRGFDPKRAGLTLLGFIESSLGNKLITGQQVDFVFSESRACLVDHIGRYERLEKDYNRIRRLFRGATSSLPHLNKTTHMHYSEYYDSRSRDLIAHLFRDDIKEFGYSFEYRRP